MKKFVIVFAFIVGFLNLVEAVWAFCTSRGVAFMIGTGIGLLLEAFFMIGLGWFLHDNEARLDNSELRIKETRKQMVNDCNRVVENVNKAAKMNMEKVSRDIQDAKESNQEEVQYLVEKNKEVTVELEECKRRIEELTALVADLRKS